MILGMSTATFTLIHVVISLIGIFSGLVFLFSVLGSKKSKGWTALFLVSTVLTRRAFPKFESYQAAASSL
jgi:hypothetical protein